MANITHADEVVTKGDLSDFYAGILPYLGGMPEAVCNKFSKGDLYSTTEKIVGCWIDGKPIYQKVIQTTFPTYGNEKYVSIGASIGWADAKVQLIDSSGWVQLLNRTKTSEKSPYGLHFAIGTNSVSSDKNSLYLANQATTTTFDNATVYATIRYTKTTDAANSFKYGFENDYSTSEKIVGTWVNGKPIYQKTISCGNLPNNSSKTVAHGVSNLDSVINITGYTYILGGASMTTKYYTLIPNHSPSVAVRADSTSIYLQTTSNLSTSEAYVTIQYTKTTD